MSDEQKHHRKIAGALAKAAKDLRSNGQVDPLLYGSLHFLAQKKPDRFGKFHTVRGIEDGEPRLSELLDALAWFIEGRDFRVFDLHRFDTPELGFAWPKTIGKKGAAVEAAARVRAFFERHTGKPHDALVNAVVDAYFPGESATNSSDSAYRRSLRAKRTNRKKTNSLSVAP